MNLEKIAQLLFGGIIAVVAVIAVVGVLGVPLWVGLAWWFGHVSFELAAIVLLVLAVYSSAA
jgi:type IV secretory pathway VirB2 component (pilin)